MDIKQWLAFAYDNYYPSGGMSDSVGRYTDLETAKKAIEQNGRYYGEVVEVAVKQDRLSMRVVARWNSSGNAFTGRPAGWVEADDSVPLFEA